MTRYKEALDWVNDEGHYMKGPPHILDAIRQALSSMIEGGWRPISEAPRDGTRFLFTNGKIIACGWYMNGQYFASDSFGGKQALDPTHYMPLPAAPEGGSDE